MSTEAAPSSANSAYDRASCEYQTRNGLVATSPAATTPVRRDTRTTPAPYATGIVAVPASAESDRSPTSPSPNTELQAQATT